MEKFGDLVDMKNPYPLAFLDQYSLAELSAELAIASFNGQLMLQALGLGGGASMGLTGSRFLAPAAIPRFPD